MLKKYRDTILAVLPPLVAVAVWGVNFPDLVAAAQQYTSAS